MPIPASVEHMRVEFERVCREDLIGCSFEELCEKIAKFSVHEVEEAMDHVDGESFISSHERLTELVIEAHVAEQFDRPKIP